MNPIYVGYGMANMAFIITNRLVASTDIITHTRYPINKNKNKENKCIYKSGNKNIQN